MKPPHHILDRIAEGYVHCVLAVGTHDADYVDAYYGPPEWKERAAREKPGLEEVRDRAAGLHATLQTVQLPASDTAVGLRQQYLLKQIHSLIARVDYLVGNRRTFDDESLAMYDAVAPTYSHEHFDRILDELSALLPGHDPIPERYDRFKREFIIPKEKLHAVFTAAITEARTRTRRHLPLPDVESFDLEYVTGKSWSGYNWYKGSAHSLIQINTDLPIYIDRAIDLASHEGYPGHHVYNALLEKTLVRQRGWTEFSVYALFSPQSLIAEGTANYGIALAFPGPERVAFERATLFPLAGMDASKVELYYRIHDIVQRLNYAGNEAARRYLDGKITRDEAAQWLVTYALMSPERAEQRTRFFDQYRSYVINYNLGQDIVGRYIESRAGTDMSKRWKEFEVLLTSPHVPSGLIV